MAVDIFELPFDGPHDDGDVIQFLQELYTDIDRVDRMSGGGFTQTFLLSGICKRMSRFGDIIPDRQRLLCIETASQRHYGM